MDNDLVTLKFNEYEANTPNLIGQLLNDQTFTDVTLVTVGGLQIKAHKFILSACSLLFEKILLQNTHHHPFIYLNGIQYKNLSLITKFLYLGQCQVETKDLESFLEAGKELEIHGLMEYTEDFRHVDNSKQFGIEEEFSNTNYLLIDNKCNDNKEDLSGITLPESITYKETRTQIREPDLQDLPEKVAFNDTMEEIQTIICDVCSQELENQSELVKHIATQHEGKAYSCHKCEKSFRLDKSRKVHIQSKHEGFRFKCLTCEHQSITKRGLRAHTRFIHDGVGFQCNQCSRKFSLTQALNYHKEKIHGQRKTKIEIPNYTCDFCNTMFADEPTMKKHREVNHSGIQYGCNLCPYQSDQLNILKAHKRLTHEGLKSNNS